MPTHKVALLIPCAIAQYPEILRRIGDAGYLPRSKDLTFRNLFWCALAATEQCR
jgi:hypothetical protein